MSKKPSSIKKHSLIIVDVVRKRMARNLFWLLLLVGLIGLADWYFYILADKFWHWVWVAFVVLFIIWVYYAFLMRRVSIQVHSGYLYLQGPLRGFRISYGRITTATSTNMAQHFNQESLSKRDYKLIEPFINEACLFVGLNGYPKGLNIGNRRLWLPDYLFGTTQPGLLLLVPDWMQLSRDIETARFHWQERRMKVGEQGTLASQVMDRAQF